MKGTIFKIKRFSVHDGPGIRTSVFLKGCPLKCIWCHSPEGISNEISIWHNKNLCISCGECVKACPNKALRKDTVIQSVVKINRELCQLSGDCVRVCPSNAMQFTGTSTTSQEVIKEIEKDLIFYKSSGGGVTLTGGEPLYQPDFIEDILKESRKMGIHTAVETCLFCDQDTLKTLSEYIDLFIVDIKIFDPVKHRTYTGRSNKIIMDNFCNIASLKKEIIIRIPVVNKITDTEENLYSIKKFVHGINKNIPIEYISYNPLTRNNYDKSGIPFFL